MTDAPRGDGYNEIMVIEEQRERVIEQLQAGFAGDLYEVDELERRLALAQSAESPAALAALVTDLVPSSPSRGAMVATRHVRVVLGSVERRGPWALPERLSARVAFGNLMLDLRDAQIGPGVSEIEVSVTMGNLEIVVPPDITVDLSASSFLGNVEDRSESARGGGRVVRVVGRVKLGNLEVSTLQRGETRWEGRWRRRYERRARRRVMRHRQLPRPYEW